MKKKFISYLCVIALVVAMFPVSAFAAGANSWNCPYCNTKNYLDTASDTWDDCSKCGRYYDKCPDCSSWVWWNNTSWQNGICPNCGYDQYNHDVRANLRNQIYAYGQSNRLVIDLTYDVNWIYVYRINSNGSEVHVASFDPWKADGYYKSSNRNYDYSIEYYDTGLKRDTKYRYYVYYEFQDCGETILCGTTATKIYWTAPKAKASNVKKNGSKVTWSKVSGADGYRVTFKRYKNIGYHQWWLTNRNQWTTRNSAYRKLDPSPYYKYERVGEVRTYAKHGDKYYAHGKKVRTVKKNLFL